MTDTPPVPPHDPRPGSRLRPAIMALPTAIWCFFEAGFLASVAVFAPKLFARWRTGLIRAWGSVALWMLGIKLEVHGHEEVDAAPGSLVMFNHVSLLDLQVLAALWPKGAAVVYKKEFHKVPGIGQALSETGMVAVDRSDPIKARASLDHAVTVLRDEKRSVLIAPEGTRSRAGGLLPFKLGPFHMAAGSRCLVFPFIMRGLEQLMPMGSWIPRTGTVRVDILPPIRTDDWRRSRVRQHADEVREIFLRYVPPAPGATPEEIAAQREEERRERREKAAAQSATDTNESDVTATAP